AGWSYHENAIVLGAQTERRGGAGPVRGLLGGKDPTGRFFRSSQVRSQPSPRLLAVGRIILVRAREDRTPPTELSSEITVWDDLAAGPGSHPGEDADVDIGSQELHVAVREQGEGPVGVEAINLPVVRAIDGALAVKVCPVPFGAAAPQQASRGPGAAGQPLVQERLASLPQLRPARAFGHHDRVRGAVRNVVQARGAVDREDPLVMPVLVTRATWRINQSTARQFGIDS